MTKWFNKSFANSLRCDLPLEQIRARLNETGRWEWIKRDNDNWGPYISAAPSGDYRRAIVKILHAADGYAVNVDFSSPDLGAEAEFEAMRQTLFEHLLPAIGARDLGRFRSPGDRKTIPRGSENPRPAEIALPIGELRR